MADPSAILGAVGFLGASGALLYGCAVAGVVIEALRPERKTVGWALARGLPTEPTAWGLPAREWCAEFAGARCPVFDIGEHDRSAPTAIVLHGYARSRYDSLSRLGALLPHARRFLLVDLPGHGEASGRTTRLGTDEDRMIADLAAEQSDGPLLLVGHSLGATVAIHAASDARIAPRVQGVLALAPYESLRTPLGARLDLRAMPRRAVVPAALRALSSLGVVERSTSAAAARLGCPLAVVAGEADPVTPLSEARAIAAAAAAGWFASVPHGRHDDFTTAGRAQMNAALAWIASAASKD